RDSSRPGLLVLEDRSELPERHVLEGRELAVRLEVEAAEPAREVEVVAHLEEARVRALERPADRGVGEGAGGGRHERAARPRERAPDLPGERLAVGPGERARRLPGRERELIRG